MRDALWIARKNELCSLIKQVSDSYGGDDRGCLREYAKELIESASGDFSKAIDCFRVNLIGVKRKPCDNPKIKPIDIKCHQCGYVPPFCFYYYDENCSTKNIPK